MPFDIHNVPLESIPRIHSRPPLLRPEQVEVGVEGELVTITVGNSTLKLHYESALKLSQWVRVRAKQAKRECGDVSRHWSAVAVLDWLEQ